MKLKDCEVKDDILYIESCVYISDDAELKTIIIKYIYKLRLDEYAERLFTYDRASFIYYWPGIIDSIFRYMKSCYICKRLKTYREGKQGLLKSLSIPDRY